MVSDRIQTIVQSRNFQNFDEIAETALVEESAISSKLDRYRSEGIFAQRCSNCGKLGHLNSKCYSRGKREARVNPVVTSGGGTLSHLTCFRYGEKGHLASNCKKPPRRKETSDSRRTPGNESRRTESSRPTVASVGCLNREKCDYAMLKLNIGKGDKLYFLVDSGVDISLVKSQKLLGTTEFEPRDRVRVKGVDGSTLETNGSIKARIQVGGLEIPYSFQLVSHQIDLRGDGILGRDFLKAMQAHICYKERLLTFQYKGTIVRKKLGLLPELKSKNFIDRGVNKLTLPARAEVIV